MNRVTIFRYISNNLPSPSFPVQSIPTTFIISKTGEIVVDKNGAANWNSDAFRHQLDELINE